MPSSEKNNVFMCFEKEAPQLLKAKQCRSIVCPRPMSLYHEDATGELFYQSKTIVEA
jgi:hypothetical protein